MSIDDKRLLAWLDGELDEAGSAEVAAAVAADPGLAARAEQHRRLRAILRRSFDPLLEAPVPEPLREAARPSADILAFRPRADIRPARFNRWPAIAATLVAGLIGGMLVGRADDGPVRVDNGRMIATGPTARALDRQLAADSGGPVRVALTFRNGAGQWCRSFTGNAASGVACRTPAGWQIEGLFPGAAASAPYRMASGGDPRLGGLVDTLMSGDPLDAAAERKARDGGWIARTQERK